MAAASSGRAHNVHTLAEAYCNLIEGCASAGEWERGNEWCELVSEFAITHKTEPLFGACRTVHANVLVATGQWPQAEDALEGALAIHARNVPQMSAPAVAALAELRVLRGRLLATPNASFEAARRSPPRCAPWRCFASRKDERRRRPRCCSGACSARRTTPSAPLRSSRRWSTPASSAATSTRRRPPRPAPEMAGPPASASSSPRRPGRGASGLADGRRADAAEPARRALTAFSQLAMPFGAGQARLELARALVDEAPGLARTRPARHTRRSANSAPPGRWTPRRDFCATSAAGRATSERSRRADANVSWRCSSSSPWGCPTRASARPSSISEK